MSDTNTCSQHLSNLNQCGVSVVKETLSPTQTTRWIETTNEAFANQNNNIAWNFGRAHLSVSKRSSRFSDFSKIGESCSCNENEGAQNAPSGWAFGNFWKRKYSIDAAKSAAQQTTDTVTLQNIVKSYFEQHKIERYELTDVQFLNAYPESNNQIWHKDNTCCGLTAIIALKDVRSNGPTELLLGTHKQNFSLWTVFQDAVLESNDNKQSLVGKPMLGVIDAGDALLYDARIFHRGRGFRKSASDQQDRPVLVLRWDAASTPPPGAGLIKTTANTYIGCFLYAALSLIQNFNSR